MLPTCRNTQKHRHCIYTHVQYLVHWILHWRKQNKAIHEHTFSPTVCTNVSGSVCVSRHTWHDPCCLSLILNPHILWSPPINNWTPHAPNLKRQFFPWRMKRDSTVLDSQRCHNAGWSMNRSAHGNLMVCVQQQILWTNELITLLSFWGGQTLWKQWIINRLNRVALKRGIWNSASSCSYHIHERSFCLDPPQVMNAATAVPFRSIL